MMVVMAHKEQLEVMVLKEQQEHKGQPERKEILEVQEHKELKEKVVE